jgi:hypothetical protein
MAPQGMVVKNTFLQLGENPNSGGWRRQMSEPAKALAEDNRLSHNQDSGSELDENELLSSEVYEQLNAGDAMNHVGTGYGPTISVSSTAAAGGKGAQVLKLADSIPFQQQKEAAERKRQSSNSKEYPPRDNLIKDIDITKKQPPWTDVTTVMMRNLPNKYTQQMLLEELQDAGFRLQQDFDFFYLPMDHSNAANLGYCFINLALTSLANSFSACFSGKKMRRFNSSKTVVVMPASIQGYERNYQYYSSTRVAQAEDPAYRPLFLRTPMDGSAPQQQWQPPPPQPSPKSGLPAGGNKGKGQNSGKNASNGNFAKGGGKSKQSKGGANNAPTTIAGFEVAGPWQQMPMPSMPMQQMPLQTQQLQPPPPPPPLPAAKPQMTACWNCGKDVGPMHRFCAFCGAAVNHEAEPALPKSPGSMRADAPTFIPGGGNDTRQPMPPTMPLPQAMTMPVSPVRQVPMDAHVPKRDIPGAAPLSPLNNYGDSVTDELDVMRGRMMLLAALKDMEKREGREAGNSETDALGTAALSVAFSGMPGDALDPRHNLPMDW